VRQFVTAFVIRTNVIGVCSATPPTNFNRPFRPRFLIWRERFPAFPNPFGADREPAFGYRSQSWRSARELLDDGFFRRPSYNSIPTTSARFARLKSQTLPAVLKTSQGAASLSVTFRHNQRQSLSGFSQAQRTAKSVGLAVSRVERVFD